MTLIKLTRQAEKLLHDNSPVILTAIGVSGTLSTAYLTAKATYAVGYDEALNAAYNEPPPVKERIARHWKLYIPAAISATLTVGCIIAANRVGSKRAAAAYSVLSVTEKAFSEYKDKVVETIGERKERTIQDAVVQDRVNANPASGREILVTGSGNVLCCELFTGRYFNSDMESLRKAENKLNSRLNREMYARLSDFYSLVGLPYTSNSEEIGWDSDKLLELRFTTVLSDDGRPCIAFDYNYTKPM